LSLVFNVFEAFRRAGAASAGHSPGRAGGSSSNNG